MRKSLLLAVLPVSAVIALTIFYNLPTFTSHPCSEPITYRIASIDERFYISEKKVKKVMQEVESLWATAIKRPLISYSDSGEVGVYLTYGEEQQFSREEWKVSNKISNNEQQLDILKTEYERISHLFQKKEKDLKVLASKRNQMIEEFNKTFNELKRDGISGNDRQVIRRKEQQVNNVEYRIDQIYSEAESIRNRINQKADLINLLRSETNELILTYNKKFTKVRKFHQGHYVEKGDHQMIEVFQFDNYHELKLVLAHEIGHALGLDHVQNPESVMYYLLEEQNLYDLSLSPEDIAAIKERCTDN